MVFPLTCYRVRLLTVQMACHIYVRLWHHLHQMLVRYEQYLYHLLMLHIRRMLHRMLSYAVFQQLLLHSHIMVRILCILNLFLCMFPALHMQVFLLLHLLIFQELYQAVLLPYSIHIHLQLLLLRMFLLDLHKDRCWMEVSMVLLSMQGNMLLHLRL